MGMTIPITQTDIDELMPLSEEEILTRYWPEISTILSPHGLAGERLDESLVRYYQTIFKPKLALLAHKQHQAAIRLQKSFAENSLDISLVSVGLVANCIIDMEDFPVKPQQKVLAGLALLILKIALKKPKQDDKP